MKPFLLLMLGIWVGMLIGISFVEAPLKFTAPNITLPLGLGIGKIVFSALNKFEIVFSILLSIWLCTRYKSFELLVQLAIITIIAIVFIQTVWLLPVLTERADRLIKGGAFIKSYHHFYYVALELAKVALLIYGYVKIYQHGGHSG